MFGLFFIEPGQEPVAVLNQEGKPMVYETGQEAASARDKAAQGYMVELGYTEVKCQVRPILSDAWKAREQGRFDDGTYTHLPWVYEDWFTAPGAPLDHFAHVSTQDGGQIAYTPDGVKGTSDRQIRVSPGRYLAQFYGNTLSPADIARLSAEFRRDHGGEVELEFATTADEIEEVYNQGPRSCMSFPEDGYAGDEHPARVYAAGDLAVAYIRRDDRITARALVWPNKLLRSTIYGDEAVLDDLLSGAGYKKDNLNGARLLKIECKNEFIMPYIDGCLVVEDCGDHFLIGGGCVPCNFTSGLSGPAMRCYSCREALDEDDYSLDDDDNKYCYSCFDEQFPLCEHHEETCERESMERVVVSLHPRSSQSWGRRAVDMDAFLCPINDAYYHVDLGVQMVDGVLWSEDAYEDRGALCEGSGEYYPADETLQLENGITWSKEHFLRYGITIEGKRYDAADAPTSEPAEPSQDPTPRRRKFASYCPQVGQLELPHIEEPYRVTGPDSDGDYAVRSGVPCTLITDRAIAEMS